MSKSKNDAVIVQAVRTPVGKMRQSLATVSPLDLGTAVVKEVVQRAGLDPVEIDETIFANLFDTDWVNLARLVGLNAGFPVSVPGISVDRQCSSSLNALAYGALLINTGNADVVLAGGVESYSQQPFLLKRPETGFPASINFLQPKVSVGEYGNPPMIETAENLAKQYNVTREECDEFALLSHQKAAKAWENERFKDQVVNFEVAGKKGSTMVTMDECVRMSASLEDMSKLKPVMKDGVVTAGNSSPMNDGASAMLVMSRAKAESMGLEILGVVTGFASAGVDPRIMGIGPVAATQKLMKKNGLKISDFDLIEINEAFAAQSIPCVRDLEMDMERVNVNGGAIAIGHPNAASGGILVARLVYEMRRRDVKRGLVTFCCGGGQGFSTMIERD